MVGHLHRSVSDISALNPSQTERLADTTTRSMRTTHLTACFIDLTCSPRCPAAGALPIQVKGQPSSRKSKNAEAPPASPDPFGGPCDDPFLIGGSNQPSAKPAKTKTTRQPAKPASRASSRAGRSHRQQPSAGSSRQQAASKQVAARNKPEYSAASRRSRPQSRGLVSFR